MNGLNRLGGLLLLTTVLFLSGCGYELVRDRGISGGEILSVSVPVFKNRTFEPQMPEFFTQAFSHELAAGGLVDINRSGSDAVLQGTITSLVAAPSSLSGSGIALEKVVAVGVLLTLTTPGGTVKTWTFSDSEAYRANDINLEDFNKRAALRRIAGRIARRFHAQLVANR
jgi:outer membrane lipopolysaccharide assembly protein LptE/RlpB